MGLESGSFISDLNVNNPLTTDSKQEGDNHIRLIKTVLKGTFPNATKAIYFPDSANKSAGFTVLATEMNRTFLVSTAAGQVNITMPALAAADAGWQCFVTKTTSDVNPMFILPPSGTILSGPLSLSYTRRAIPNTPVRIFWTGSNWVAERAARVPVGSIISFDGTSIPVGYELPNGQTLSTATYPDFAAVKAGGVTRNLMGRVVVMKESTATLLTVAGSGINGAVVGSTGGTETHQLTGAQNGAHQHDAFIHDPQHTHTTSPANLVALTGAGGLSFGAGGNGSATIAISAASTGVQVKSTSGGAADNKTAMTATATAHQNTQPTIVLDKLLVVE